MLSDHERSEKLRRGRELIEEFLRDVKSEYGVSAEERVLPDGPAWWLILRNNHMIVDLTEFPPDTEFGGRTYAGAISVYVHVAKLPTNNLLPLYRHLLEMNRMVMEGAFGIAFDNLITFGIRRDVDSVDSKEELKNLVEIVIECVNAHVDRLFDEFDCIPLPLEPWTLPAS